MKKDLPVKNTQCKHDQSLKILFTSLQIFVEAEAVAFQKMEKQVGHHSPFKVKKP